jgi:hypothetical protein
MKSPNSKGRPILKTGRRSKKIDARFTEDEYLTVLNLEKQLGISKTDLIRMRLLENIPSVILNAKELIEDLDYIGAEMNRAGNNINQLAKHANVLNKKGMLSIEIVQRNNELLENWIAIQRELETSLRKIIRQMSR